MIIIVALWPCIALAVWPFSSTFYEIKVTVTRGTRKYTQTAYSIGKPATEGVFTVYKEYPSGREVRIKTSDVSKIIELEKEPSPQKDPPAPASSPSQQTMPISPPVVSSEEKKPSTPNVDLKTATIEELIPLAERGDAEAQYILGQNYFNGNKVLQNEIRAFEWFLRAAGNGQVLAQTQVGWMLKEGKGVQQNYDEARKWYLKAAEAGSAGAQNDLGLMYEGALGVTMDFVEAAKWFLKSADQGNRVAQFNLAMCFYDGKGVAQSHTEAHKWFLKAALQDDPLAQFSLGMMYADGLGVRQDFVESYAWFTLAARKGLTKAEDLVKTFESNAPELVPQSRGRATMLAEIVQNHSSQQK